MKSSLKSKYVKVVAFSILTYIQDNYPLKATALGECENTHVVYISFCFSRFLLCGDVRRDMGRSVMVCKQGAGLG